MADQTLDASKLLTTRGLRTAVGTKPSVRTDQSAESNAADRPSLDAAKLLGTKGLRTAVGTKPGART